MVYKPTPKKRPADPGTLLPFEFQEFVQHFPDAALTKAQLKRSAFVSVAMMLSRHGDFATGMRVRPSVGTLADEAGVSKPTVRRVLAFLKKLDAIVKTGEHRNAGGGSPVTEYRLYRSGVVDEVLSLKDRNVRSGKQGTTATPSGESREPLSGKQRTTEGKAENHNRNHKERKESEVEESPSRAPVVAPPTASDGATEVTKEDDFDVDEFILENLDLFDGEL
ncbi:hypothetical protein ACLD0U_04275 [Microbacterium sp. 2216-1]|uniref:hypothetical protein n=1 Tax=Microbacterium sp. 2216-1 TaxID=3390053 RepID=UPI0039762636